MADDRADAAVVHCVVSLRIEKGWLKDSGRKDDLVEVGIVVSIHGWRGDAPLGLVNRLADFVQIALVLELARLQDILDKRRAIDRERRIVAPVIRIADFNLDRISLAESLLARVFANPIERGDAIAQSGFEIRDHRQRAGFRFGCESLGDVELSERLAE